MLSPEEREALQGADPDPLDLIDVLELIAPGAVANGWTRLRGGLQTALHRIDVRMPSGAQTAFVLRRYLPEAGDDGATALREAATLEALRPTPVPAPELLWLDQDGNVFGRPAIAMTLLAGDPLRPQPAAPSAETAGSWARSLAQVLVTIQWTPLPTLDHLPRLTDSAALVAWVLDAPIAGSEVVDAAAVAAALERASEVEPLAPVLLHGDFHPGNILRAGADVTGVVDWAGALVGDPRLDVASCALDLALTAGQEAADEFRAAYEQLRGATPDWWLFALLAAARALPDPADWLPSYRARGIELDGEVLRTRFRAFVAEALAAVPPLAAR